MKPASSSAKDVRAFEVGDVRTRVLAEHERLRSVIAEVDKCATMVAAGDEDEDLVERLRGSAERLYHLMETHIDHEDAALAPLIRRIDAWGPVRFEQMQRDHMQQREALALAVRDLAIKGERLGRTVQSTLWDILHDMKREEHDLLHPDLWREDVTTVEVGG